MQQQVQLADRERAEVALLPVQHEVARVPVLLGDVLRGVDQHPGRPRGRVADAHPLGRLEQLDDQPHDGAGGVELAALLACVVRELADQVLVGVAEHVHRARGVVGRQVRVAQVEFAEVAQQAADDAVAVERVAELRLVVPVGVAQHPVEPGRVQLLDRGARAVDDLTEVHRLADDRLPARLGRHEELVLVRVALGDLAGDPVGDGALDLLGEAVGEPLQEEHREDVVLVSRSSRSARAGCRPRPTAWTRTPSW